MTSRAMPWWAWAAPVAAGVLLAGEAFGILHADTPYFGALGLVILVASVFAVVRHAETISSRLGELLGTVLLALSVTAIEVSLIASVMIQGGPGAETVARDTVFAGIMVVVNGVMGMALLLGGLRHREQAFQLQGTASALGVLGTLAITSMILPDYTVSKPGPVFSPAQLWFVSLASLTLYVIYMLVQVGRQRQYFVSPGIESTTPAAVSPATVILSAGLLIATLVMVALLSDAMIPLVRSAVVAAGFYYEFVGVLIAMLVLMPEGASSLIAARSNRLQSSLNFALGSAIASVGLTIPVVSLLSVILDVPIELGLNPEHVVLLAMTLFIATLTLSTGRTTVLQGAVHLVIFVVFLLIAAVP